jgi:hypothetical protein
MMHWHLLDSSFPRALAYWGCDGVWLGLMAWCATRWLLRRATIAPSWVPLAAGGYVALCGYGAFWLYFWAPLAGRIFSFSVLGLAVIANLRHRGKLTPAGREAIIVACLQVCIGVFYLSLLYLFAAPAGFYDLASHRFMSLPSDNHLSHDVADRLIHGTPLKPFIGNWLSSDRPPLQSGWQLLTWPVTAALGTEESLASGMSAIWFELLWIPAVYGLLRSLDLTVRKAAGWTLTVALSGFFLQHSIFTWPKLAAGAFVCGAYGCWALPVCRGSRRQACAAGAACAALGCLAHTGVAFSLLPLVPWIAWRSLRGEAGAWLLAGVVFAALLLPWAAYQRFYDPPGNRLIKWHLGGQAEVNSRTTWQTLRDGYRSKSWKQIAADRWANVRVLFSGDIEHIGNFTRATAPNRRGEEFFNTARAFTWWAAGILALPFALLRLAARERPGQQLRNCGALAGWIVATFLVWCLLMFIPGQTVVHQGSFGSMIAGFALLSAWLELASPWSMRLIAALQAATLFSTWVVPNGIVHGPLDPLALIAGAGAATIIFAGIIASSLKPSGRQFT